MTINFSIDAPDNKLGEILQQLMQVLGSETNMIKTTVDPPAEYKKTEPEKAIKPTPKNVEKAIPQSEVHIVPLSKPDEAPANKPSYSITTIRAKAKEIAGIKGNAFLRECLEAVGASSISTIAEEKYDEFMNLLME